MTKYELNKRLAELLGKYEVSGDDESGKVWVKLIDPPSPLCCGWVPFDVFSRHNGWNKLMPLAIDHGLTLSPIAGHCIDVLGVAHEWECTDKSGSGSEVWDKDPATAIVKCLIAKLESENE